MIILVANNTVKQEKQDEFIQLTKRLIEETRKEDGCIYYNLVKDKNNPEILTFIERWESEKHLKDHSNTPHFIEIVPQIKKIREKGNLNIYEEFL